MKEREGKDKPGDTGQGNLTVEAEEPGCGGRGKDRRTGCEGRLGERAKRNTFGRNRATIFAQERFTHGAFTLFIVTTKTQHLKENL